MNSSRIASNEFLNSLDSPQQKYLSSFLQLSPDQQVKTAKHPIEIKGIIDNKLTPSQRAICACLWQNNGVASETVLLSFMKQYWDLIKSLSPKLNAPTVDSRILHINLAAKKKGIPLFIPIDDTTLVFTFNTNSSLYLPPNRKRSKEQSQQNDQAIFQMPTAEQLQYMQYQNIPSLQFQQHDITHSAQSTQPNPVQNQQSNMQMPNFMNMNINMGQMGMGQMNMNMLQINPTMSTMPQIQPPPQQPSPQPQQTTNIMENPQNVGQFLSLPPMQPPPAPAQQPQPPQQPPQLQNPTQKTSSRGPKASQQNKQQSQPSYQQTMTMPLPILSSGEFPAETMEMLILKILEVAPNGCSINDLIKATERSQNLPGLYTLLEHSRRIKAITLSLKIQGCLKYENGVYYYKHNPLTEKKDATPPPPAEKTKSIISSMTVEQYWNYLKLNNVY